MNGGWNGYSATYDEEDYPDSERLRFYPLFQPDPRRFKCFRQPYILSDELCGHMVARDWWLGGTWGIAA